MELTIHVIGEHSPFSLISLRNFSAPHPQSTLRCFNRSKRPGRAAASAGEAPPPTAAPSLARAAAARQQLAWAECLVEGSGRLYGLPVRWRLRWRPSSGAFVEELEGQHVGARWGYRGRLASSGGSGAPAGTSGCWEADYTGAALGLHLDDAEHQLLTGWLRTGAWAHPALAAALDVRPLPPAAAGGSVDGGGNGGPGGPEERMLVRLRGGRAEVEAALCPASGALLRLRRRGAGQGERWALEGHRQWAPGLTFPALGSQHTPSGTQQYRTETASGTPAAAAAADALLASSAALFAPPPPAADGLPPRTRWLAGVAGEAQVQGLHTPSGHLLVRPLVDGRPLDMLLDSGASGLVIDPDAADSLGLQALGELAVVGAGGAPPRRRPRRPPAATRTRCRGGVLTASAPPACPDSYTLTGVQLSIPMPPITTQVDMHGASPSRFRRAASLQLGPLLIERPLLMEAACSHLRLGLPRPLAGIVGWAGREGHAGRARRAAAARACRHPPPPQAAGWKARGPCRAC